RSGWLAGAFLGLSMLSKGFVPLVLFAPVWLFARGRRIAIPLATIAVSAPWYIACTLANGGAFWNEFFWRHHIARFFTSGMEHIQPWWFYIEVLLGAIFPWTPLLGLMARKKTYQDTRVQF